MKIYKDVGIEIEVTKEYLINIKSNNQDIKGLDLTYFINCLKINNNQFYDLVYLDRYKLIKKLEQIKLRNNIQDF